MDRPDLAAIEARLKAATPAPCPFCGGEPETSHVPGHWVRCSRCHAEGPESEDAIAAWNQRHERDALLAYVRELEAERDRLADVLRCERGEWAPEGWVYSFQQSRWEGPGLCSKVWRNAWMRDAEKRSYIAWGWEVWIGEEQLGTAPTALDAIHAANAALAGGSGA